MSFAATILTLYPEMFPGPLGVSLAGRALERGDWSCETLQIRDFATDKHRTVDDTPAGGGAGMVLKCDVLAAAVDHAVEKSRETIRSSRAQSRDAGADASPGVSTALDTNGEGGTVPIPASTSLDPNGGEDTVGMGDTVPILAMTPRGKPITQQRIRELAAGPGVVLLCGRFEGFDERLFEARPAIEQVSLGDIVLSGGEPAALAILDACIRLLPGVMGAPSSGAEESFENGLLEYPQYTRPQQWEGRTIPEVLRSGDHAKIAAWRQSRSEHDTRLRRPDLWECRSGVRDQSASGARHKD